MTPPEKVGDAPPRFVFGSGVVKPQIQHNITPEDAEPQESAESCSTEILCLRRSNLQQVPQTVLRNGSLTYLCLEGNQISSIPDSMFLSLPRLEWLDLRRNLITSLPAEIGSHRCLRTLALEANPISELPPELGNVTTLRCLCLRDCPIRFPPQDVVHQGYQSILRYLQGVLAEREASARKASPVVEKLQLSELMESNVEAQDEEEDDEDELVKFRELKDKFIQLDMAELSVTAHGDEKPKSQLPGAPKRKTIITRAGIIPELPLSDSQHGKGQRRRDIAEQTRPQQPPLRRRTPGKRTQEKKISEHKQKRQERQRKPEETDSKPTLKDRSRTFRGPACGICTENEEDRYARELQQQICARAQRLQERHRNPRGTKAEQMAVTQEDVEEMRRLQERLLERKRNQRTHCKKCFYTSTEDSWQSLFS